MAVVHVQVRSGEGLLQVARRLAPVGVTDAQAFKFAQSIAVASGLVLSAPLFVGQVLHVDDTQIPTVVTPPTFPPPTVAGQFYIKNGRIGRDGRQWVPIGVNGVSKPATAPVGDWWNDTGMGVMNGRSRLFVELGFNFVRFNDMRDYAAYSFDSFQQGLYEAMDEYLAAGVTVMPTYHRMGPGTNPTPAQIAANADYGRYWSGIVNRYKGNPNVIVNPLNEPTGTAWASWSATAKHQHDHIRSLGWEGLVVLDLPQWAQGIQHGVDAGAAWVKANTVNTALGFHNYAMGDQTAAVRAIQAQGVPVLVGECGATLGEVNTSSFDWCVANADALGVGCVFWWGAGNRNDDYVLRARRGATFYDTTVPVSPAGAKMFALAKSRPVQPNL